MSLTPRCFRCSSHAPYSSELQREKAWSRIHLVPLLLAEGDRDAYRRNEAAIAREKEIMKDVEGECVMSSRHPPPLFLDSFCVQLLVLWCQTC